MCAGRWTRNNCCCAQGICSVSALTLRLLHCALVSQQQALALYLHQCKRPRLLCPPHGIPAALHAPTDRGSRRLTSRAGPAPLRRPAASPRPVAWARPARPATAHAPAPHPWGRRPVAGAARPQPPARPRSRAAPPPPPPGAAAAQRAARLLRMFGLNRQNHTANPALYTAINQAWLPENDHALDVEQHIHVL